MTTKQFVLLVLFFFLMFLSPFAIKKVNSGPIFRGVAGNIVVTLYDDKCAVDGVKNLPNKAIWQEGGKGHGRLLGAVPDFWVVDLLLRRQDCL